MTPHELAKKICEKLRDAGHQAFFVGGCVRDLLLGREPADYDVATDATPEYVQRLFPRSVSVGAKFGVIIVYEDDCVYENDRAHGGTDIEEKVTATTSSSNALAKVEVATFRRDIGYSDGRHPDRVEYSLSPEEDVRRRDFTINGLMLDPTSGEVLDFVGGRDDLRAQVVRAIGDPSLRFQEDKLRMIRAVRFAARFGYRIEPATFVAIRSASEQITEVSAERARDEMTKLLTDGAARRAFELLDEAHLLQTLLPEVAKMKGVEQPPQFHPEGDVWIHTRMMLAELPPGTSCTLAWAVLLHDVGKPPTFVSAEQTGDRIRFNGHAEMGARMAVEICRRLKFSAEDTGQIEELVANHLRFKDVFGMRAATLKRFVRLPRFEEHLELHRLDCLCSHGKLDAYEFVQRFLRETPPEQVRPARLIGGDDLKEMGYAPGPRFKEILDAVEEAQLDSGLNGREEALEFIRAKFPPVG